MKEDYQKPLKKSTLFFLPNPVPFNGQSYQKQKGPGTSAQLLFISYILSDQVWWWHIKWLLSCFKNCICKFMQGNSYHKSFHFHLSFCIWKVRKGREKITKVWISQEWKELFWWNKKHFIILEGLIIWWKNLIKNSGHKL